VASGSEQYLKICVFIYDPRLLRIFKELAKGFPLNYSIPDTLSDITGYDVAIVDKEALRMIGSGTLRQNKNCTVYVVGDEEDLIRVILRVISGGSTDVQHIIAGVDLGSKIAYAILADDVLIGAGAVMTLDEFLNILTKLKRALRPLRAVVKVGLPSSDALYQLLLRLLEGVTASGYEVYVIDESRTTLKPLPQFKGLKNVRVTKDISAAINIALREGGVRIFYRESKA